MKYCIALFTRMFWKVFKDIYIEADERLINLFISSFGLNIIKKILKN